MISQHLAVLELAPDSTLDEVKKAYRRMSKLYHPDVNPSKDAHQRFLEVRAAYEYLLKYGTSTEAAFTEYFSYQEDERERWRREYRARRAAKERAEAHAREQLIIRVLRRYDYFAWVVIAFNLLLVVDFLLPHELTNDEIISASRYFEKVRRSSYYTHDELYFRNYKMRLPMGTIKELGNSKEATVHVSRLLKIPDRVEVNVGGTVRTFRQAYSIYKVHRFMIPILLLLLFLYLKTIKVPETRLTLATIVAFLGPIQLFLFLLY